MNSKKKVQQARVRDILDIPCSGCSGMGDLANCLVCDSCDSECWHYYCLQPPLKGIPAKRWICPSCTNRIRNRPTTRHYSVSSESALAMSRKSHVTNLSDEAVLHPVV
eukprot:Filipodium_phascolosomae@DN2515_c0_g1_i3.p1